MNIRNAVLNDKPGIATIFAEELAYHCDLQSEVFNRFSENNILPEGWIETIIDSKEQHLQVCESNCEIIGLILYTRIIIEDDLYKIKKWISINEIAVLESHRGNGIGSLLLDTVEKYALSEDIHSIRLEVWQNNLPAIAFYEKYDYKAKKIKYWKEI